MTIKLKQQSPWWSQTILTYYNTTHSSTLLDLYSIPYSLFSNLQQGLPWTAPLSWWSRDNQTRTSTSSYHCIHLPLCSWAHVWYFLFPPTTVNDVSIFLRPTTPLCAWDFIHSWPVKRNVPAILPPFPTSLIFPFKHPLACAGTYKHAIFPSLKKNKNKKKPSHFHLKLLSHFSALYNNKTQKSYLYLLSPIQLLLLSLKPIPISLSPPPFHWTALVCVTDDIHMTKSNG